MTYTHTQRNFLLALGIGIWGWDLDLGDEIRASGLGFVSPGWDLGFEATCRITIDLRLGRRVEEGSRRRGGIRKQSRLHNNPVADGRAGAVMQKPLAILTIFPTYRPTRQGAGSRVHD